MNKDRYQSTSARRALALLNSPLVSIDVTPCYLLPAFHKCIIVIKLHSEIQKRWMQKKHTLNVSLLMLFVRRKFSVTCWALDHL